MSRKKHLHIHSLVWMLFTIALMCAIVSFFKSNPDILKIDRDSFCECKE